MLLDGNSQENDSDSLLRRSADEEGDRGHIPYACASFPGLVAMLLDRNSWRMMQLSRKRQQNGCRLKDWCPV